MPEPQTRTTPRRFQNRIVTQTEMSPEQLLGNPRNWRRHPGAQQNAMTGVLDDVGWVQSVMMNEVTGNLIDGHMRVELALRYNEPTVPVTIVHLSEEEERLILASYDPIGTLATRDAELLSSLLDELPVQDNDALQALLDAEKHEATKLLSYDHTQTILKGADTYGRDKDDMLNDYLSTSVRQIVLILNPEQYERALKIVAKLMKTLHVDTTTQAVLHLLEVWDGRHTDAANDAEAAD